VGLNLLLNAGSYLLRDGPVIPRVGDPLGDCGHKQDRRWLAGRGIPEEGKGDFGDLPQSIYAETLVENVSKLFELVWQLSISLRKSSRVKSGM